ncbi:MAG: hypothetical protein LBT38_12025 [Deltaproteobacteria bacterium]|jgi:hypothetical protein|nr:hypothetical protein [Deltaproteobacteria bacterium]
MIKNFIYGLFVSIFLALLFQAPVWAQVKLESLERVTPPNPPGQVPFEGQFLPGDNHELIFVTSYGCQPCQTAKKVIAEVRAKAPANVRVLDIPLTNNFVPRHVQAWAVFSLVLKKWGLEEKLLNEIFELTLPAENMNSGDKIPLGGIDEHFSFLNARGYNGDEYLKLIGSYEINLGLQGISHFTTRKAILTVPIVVIDGKYYYTFPAELDGFADYLLDYVKTHPKGESPKATPKAPSPKPSDPTTPDPKTPGLTVTSLAY